jgi:hypothetical protein
VVPYLGVNLACHVNHVFPEGGLDLLVLITALVQGCAFEVLEPVPASSTDDSAGALALTTGVLVPVGVLGTGEGDLVFGLLKTDLKTDRFRFRSLFPAGLYLPINLHMSPGDRPGGIISLIAHFFNGMERPVDGPKSDYSRLGTRPSVHVSFNSSSARSIRHGFCRRRRRRRRQLSLLVLEQIRRRRMRRMRREKEATKTWESH